LYTTETKLNDRDKIGKRRTDKRGKHVRAQATRESPDCPLDPEQSPDQIKGSWTKKESPTDITGVQIVASRGDGES